MCQGETYLAIALALMTVLALVFLSWALISAKDHSRATTATGNEMGTSLLELQEYVREDSHYLRQSTMHPTAHNGRARSTEY